MFRRLKCEKDTYLTDKIVRGSRRKGANTGRAGTIDLFYLYDVSISGSATGVHELSRALIKFDLDPLRALTGSKLDYTHGSFNCELQLFDVYGGQTVPSGFTLAVHPLSRSWDEGNGRDIVYYSDGDSTNFITASYGSTIQTWYGEGASKGGTPGSADIDFILSGTYGAGVVDAGAKQLFTEGTENMTLDITRIVSATLANIIPDEGFRIAFSGSEETDSKTRFVKRFASRHHFDESFRPSLVVRYNDSIQSHESAFHFDTTGSLFMFNNDRNGPAHLLSGAGATAITGTNSLLLTLFSSGSTGIIVSSFTASQHRITSSFYVTGAYSASFALSSFTSSFQPIINASGSVRFLPVWHSLDRTTSFFTGSEFSVSRTSRGTTTTLAKRLSVTVTNVASVYRADDVVRFRVHAQDNTLIPTLSKIPKRPKSVILTRAHFSVRDTVTDRVVMDVDKTYNSTLMSTDRDGMYFDFWMDSLDPDRPYTFDVLITDGGTDSLHRNASPVFVVLR